MKTDNQMLIENVNSNAIITILIIIAIVVIIQYFKNKPKIKPPTTNSELRKLNK